MIRGFLLLVLAPLLASACATDGDNGGDVWVMKEYSGGRQCVEEYAPPDTHAVLEDQGVRVRETRTEPMAVCMACDICPAYAGRHYARIAAEDLERAGQAGFSRHAPPEPQ